MTRFWAMLRYPSLFLVLLAMIAAIPGPAETRWNRLSLWSLISLATGEILWTIVMLVRGASRSAALPHFMLGVGALLAGLPASAIGGEMDTIGMVVMLSALILLVRPVFTSGGR